MMRLQAEPRATSFYESFSDLIFGTMAMFVLLMVILLALVGHEQRKSAEVLEQTAAELSKAEVQRQAAREQLQELTEQLASLEQAVKAQGLELSIAVDTSGSMEKVLAHLLETLTTISTVMPKVSPEFRVGIVAFRSEEPNQPGTQIFRMQQVFGASQDGGRSSQAVSQFVAGLKALRGLAPIDEAVRSAIAQTSPPGAFSGHQVLFILGDVGPYESTWNDVGSIEPHERALDAQIVRDVAQWAKASERRRVVTLFSGEITTEYPDKTQSSREFFRRMAADAGQEANFTENPGKMLAYLLTAIVPDR
jgi:hypothetical protein